eukprot:GFKZ01011606.1.p1 GENE.GFKZ01011606.1~~GFKZ01011606.1.p1  ORF type:complete len:103 (+),score=2.82 GFKZ01011606.1:264-572(+)
MLQPHAALQSLLTLTVCCLVSLHVSRNKFNYRSLLLHYKASIFKFSLGLSPPYSNTISNAPTIPFVNRQDVLYDPLYMQYCGTAYKRLSTSPSSAVLLKHCL